MKNSNICRFNPSRSSDLICEHFIFETNKAQSEPVTASGHVMNIVIKGNGILRTKGAEYPIAEGTIFFILKNEIFSVASDSEFEYSYICFSGRRADEYLERLGIGEQCRIFESYGKLIPFWRDSIELCTDGNVDILSEAVLLYSIATLTPEKRMGDDFISEVITLTQENFTDPDLSIATISEEMGYSPKYLSTMFKKKKGIPFTEYLREIRLKHAIFLIENGVFSVKNVALLCGYRDALYFSKLFTKHLGTSPKEYIKQTEEMKNN